jgi:hypothetical protein
MINALASVGMRWQPFAAESACAARSAANPVVAGQLAAASVSAQKGAAGMTQTHGTQLSAFTDAAVVRPRGYAFAIRPRGTPPV